MKMRRGCGAREVIAPILHSLAGCIRACVYVYTSMLAALGLTLLTLLVSCSLTFLTITS